jgi:hypothetical protein
MTEVAQLAQARSKRRDKKLCKACQQRKALYYSYAKRKWRWDNQHTLCQQCHRSLKASSYSERLAANCTKQAA